MPHLFIYANSIETYFRDLQVHRQNKEDPTISHWEDFVPTDFCGKCAIYTQDEVVKTPVPYLLHYRLRGKILKDISRYEYSSIVETVKIPNSNDSERGRKRRECFEFDREHPLHATHCQVIRLKFKTPILMGKKVCVHKHKMHIYTVPT